jgi:two-component system, chemotaxis family, chemotaxis protein CheY
MPLKFDIADLPRTSRAPERQRRTTATALIVEDNTGLRELLAHALRRIPGITTIEACHGQEALEKITEAVPDIILTDINMPVMDGLTMLERLRASAELASVPIVVITTEQSAVDRARAFALGATSFVTKPIRAPRLLDEVRNLLGM